MILYKVRGDESVGDEGGLPGDPGRGYQCEPGEREEVDSKGSQDQEGFRQASQEHNVRQVGDGLDQAFAADGLAALLG